MGSLQLAWKDYVFGLPPMAPVPFDFFIPGFISGPIVVVDSPGCGASAWLQVRAWDTRVAASYEEAVDLDIGGYGESNTFFLDGGNPCSLPEVPPQLFGLETFSLRPVVPEPSVWALLVGGGVIWWMVWRRGRIYCTSLIRMFWR